MQQCVDPFEVALAVVVGHVEAVVVEDLLQRLAQVAARPVGAGVGRAGVARSEGRVVCTNIVPSLMLSWLNSPQKIELNQVSASSSSSRRSICAM